MHIQGVVIRLFIWLVYFFLVRSSVTSRKLTTFTPYGLSKVMLKPWFAKRFFSLCRVPSSSRLGSKGPHSVTD